MTPRPKTNWKARAIQAENELQAVKVTIGKDCLGYDKKINQLRIERDAAERARDEAIVRAAMKSPPSIEYRMKEVLPWWAKSALLFCVCLLLSIYTFMVVEVNKLETPIIQYKLVEGHTVYRSDLKQTAVLKDCQDAWRQDEREIRRLKKEKHEN